MRNFLLKTILNGMYFSGVQAACGFWTGGIGAILMLHHVRENDHSQFAPNQHLQISPRFLDKVLRNIVRSGFELVSLDEIHHCYSQKKLDRNRKMIAITLDDGYRDNLLNAVPIFRKYNAPYTIYIAPGLIDNRADLWWEDLSAMIAVRDQIRVSMPKGYCEFDVSTLEKKNRVFAELLEWLTNKISEEEQRRIVRELAFMYKIDTKAHCKEQIMNWGEISELAQDPLCTIGAHTIHHYAIARLDPIVAAWEMRESANILKAELGKMPHHFAFPYGYRQAAGPRDFKIAKELGFKTAVTTQYGVLKNWHGDQMHALPRVSLNGKFQSVRYVETLLSGLPALVSNSSNRLASQS